MPPVATARNTATTAAVVRLTSSTPESTGTRSQTSLTTITAKTIQASAIEMSDRRTSYSWVVISTGSRRIAGHGGKYMNVRPPRTNPSMPRLPSGTSRCPSSSRRPWRS